MGATQIAGGAWLKLRATKLGNITAATQAALQDLIEQASSYSGESFYFALATGCNYSEDYGVQPLEALGHLGPIEYNSFNYTCEINIDTLLAKDLVEFNAFIPSRSDVQADGALPIWKIEFVSTTADGTVYATFVGVVVSNHSVQVATNQFVTSNVRLQARARLKNA